jgi:hypothetical protein
LARRATLFQFLHAPGTLFLGLGYELLTLSGEEKTDMHALCTAYGRMNYDLFMLAAPEREQKTSFARPYPQKDPELITKSVPGGEIAFILFPEKSITQKDEDRLIHFAEELRRTKKYNLIVGMSSWGADREQDLLERRGEAFDILLGAGPGPGYVGKYLRDNRVLWMRSFNQGRSVLAVTLPELPEPGEKIVWIPDSSIMAVSYPLSADYRPDPEIEALFAP